MGASQTKTNHHNPTRAFRCLPPPHQGIPNSSNHYFTNQNDSSSARTCSIHSNNRLTKHSTSEFEASSKLNGQQMSRIGKKTSFDSDSGDLLTSEFQFQSNTCDIRINQSSDQHYQPQRQHHFNAHNLDEETFDILLPQNSSTSSQFMSPFKNSPKLVNQINQAQISTFGDFMQHAFTNSNDSSLNSFVSNEKSKKLTLKRPQYQTEIRSSSYQSSDCDNDSPHSENDYDIDPNSDSSLYVALYNFKSGGDNQLPLYKSQIVHISSTSKNGEWCEAISKSGKVGWVPYKYITPISLTKQPWYHGPTSRDTAEWLLSSGINGSFLVRDSYTHPGSRSVSVRYDGRVYHYRINEDNNRYYITRDVSFLTLAELIHHHSVHSNGLATVLLYPAPRQIDPNTILDNPSSTSIDAWEINRTHLLMNKQLGVGQWGVVYDAIWKKHNIRVAVKTLKEEMMRMEEEFLEEAEIMKSLRHPNLVQLLGVCTQEAPIYIVTEFMAKGSLLDYLRNCDHDQINGFVLMYMATQICSAMAYLESRNYVHRDLAARNCLVGDNHLVKVADFGLTRLVKEEDVYIAHVGAKFPIKWTAVEGLAYNRFTIKSDVWSYGIVLWELATYGMTPYPGVELSDVYQTLSTGYRMHRPTGCPEPIYNMMRMCWSWEPQDRPSFSELHEQIQSLLLNPNIFDLIEQQETIDRELIANEQEQVALQPSSPIPGSKINSDMISIAKNGDRRFSNGKEVTPKFTRRSSDLGQQIEKRKIDSRLPGLKSQISSSQIAPTKQSVMNLRVAPVPPRRTSSHRDSVNNSENSSDSTNYGIKMSPTNEHMKVFAPISMKIDKQDLNATMDGLEKMIQSLNKVSLSNQSNITSNVHVKQMISNSPSNRKGVV